MATTLFFPFFLGLAACHCCLHAACSGLQSAILWEEPTCSQLVQSIDIIAQSNAGISFSNHSASLTRALGQYAAEQGQVLAEADFAAGREGRLGGGPAWADDEGVLRGAEKKGGLEASPS